MTTISQIIDDVIAAEGKYVNDPNDRGGETNWGITIAVARADGYMGPMRDLPHQRAYDIYYRKFVVAPGFDKIAIISMPIAAELVDTGVNMGPKVASTFLQRALNGLNRNGKDYADLAADGAAGPATREALKAYVDKRGAEGVRRLLLLLNAVQGERYLSLAEGRAPNEGFLYGWLARIAA